MAFQSQASTHLSPAYGLNLSQVESTGVWFDKKPLASDSIVQAIATLIPKPIDNWLISDGLPNPSLPPSIDQFDVFSHKNLTPSQLVGKHSVLFTPTPLPFEDSAPVFSMRSWCQLFRQSLAEKSAIPTQISILLVARMTSPCPNLIPLLDKRFELDLLKPWKAGLWVIPDAHLAERDRQTGLVLPGAWPSPFPLVLHSFSSTGGRSAGKIPPSIHWITPPPADAPKAPLEGRAHHILLNAPAAIPSPAGTQRTMSGTRILMALNCMDPGESSTQFRHSPSLRYPPQWLPQMQRASPDSVAIAHYYVPAHIVTSLAEDSADLLEVGVRWCLLGQAPGFLINHLPRKSKQLAARPYKCQADEILDTLLAPDEIRRLFRNALVFSRWDVYVELHEGVDPQALADTLLSLDNLLLIDATTQGVVSPSSSQRVVEPPSLILVCPPTLLVQYAVEQIGVLTSIRRQQVLDRPGHALLTLEHTEAAKILLGSRIPCADAGAIILTSGCPSKDATANAEMGIPADASFAVRSTCLSQFGRSVLSIENVAAAAAHNFDNASVHPPPSDSSSGNGLQGRAPSPPL